MEGFLARGDEHVEAPRVSTRFRDACPIQGLHARLLTPEIAAALDRPEHQRFTRGAAPAFAAGPTPADVGFVSLDMPAKRGIAVNARHVLADLMRHAPRSLVRRAKPAWQFLGGHAVPRRYPRLEFDGKGKAVRPKPRGAP